MGTTETALAPSNGPGQIERARTAQPALTEEEVALLKATLLPPVTKRDSARKGQAASDEELQLFLAQCRRSGLDPFSRQIEAVRYDGEKLTIGPSIHGLRLAAVRSGEYQGTLGPFWCGPDGQWREVWLEAGHPAAARVGIRRARCPEPIWGIATWAQSARTYDGKPIARWKEAPADMLAKVAEAAALRKGFPIETAGFGQVVTEAPESYAGSVDEETGEVIDTPGVREAETATSAAGGPEQRVRELYEALGGDPRDKRHYRSDVNAAMGRDSASKEPPTQEQWSRCIAHFEGQIAGRDEAAAESSPFADRATEAVAAGETQTFAAASGLQ